MTRAPCSAAWRAYSSCALIIDSLSPVHVVCTSAARIVVIAAPHASRIAPSHYATTLLRSARTGPAHVSDGTLRSQMAGSRSTVRSAVRAALRVWDSAHTHRLRDVPSRGVRRVDRDDHGRLRIRWRARGDRRARRATPSGRGDLEPGRGLVRPMGRTEGPRRGHVRPIRRDGLDRHPPRARRAACLRLRRRRRRDLGGLDDPPRDLVARSFARSRAAGTVGGERRDRLARRCRDADRPGDHRDLHRHDRPERAVSRVRRRSRASRRRTPRHPGRGACALASGAAPTSRCASRSRRSHAPRARDRSSSSSRRVRSSKARSTCSTSSSRSRSSAGAARTRAG